MNLTFGMIKPDAINRKISGDIIRFIELNGFEIIELKKLNMTKNQAKDFYEVHKDKPFFGELVEMITSGPVFVFVIKKENAVSQWRFLMGATNPAVADLGTIRKMYGVSIGQNSVHGSDSEENAKKEIKFFFENILV
jgi:nucleoside-diphosphate kinase